jgi:voltage-gated potassium channel
MAQATLRSRLYHLLEISPDSDVTARVLDAALIILIVANVTATALETVTSLEAAHAGLFRAIEIVSGTAYTIEYLARLWVAVENPSLGPARMRRLRYTLTPLAIIDFLALLPFWLWFLLPAEIAFLRLFRLLRVLKLTRYSPAIETMGAVLRAEARSLFAALVLVVILLVFASGLVFMAEQQAQPDKFSSIPATMWWALATLTTIGYGDMVPITLLGKMIGAVVMLLGVGVVALPTAIIASGFAREIRKRDFAVTARMVASVPIFAGLDVVRLAEITGLLRPLAVPARHTIARRDEPADAMYFIVEGEVEVDLVPHPVRLGRGHFFGEVALLARRNRTATVTSTVDTQLLVLAAGDFFRLIERDPKLKEELARTASARQRERQKAAAAAIDPSGRFGPYGGALEAGVDEADL